MVVVSMSVSMSSLSKTATLKKVVKSAKERWSTKGRGGEEAALALADDPILPPPPRTNPMIWLCVIGCSMLAILVILTGLVVLIGYLAFHPHIPKLNVKGGSLNSLLLDINFLLSSDTTLIIEAHNPNDRVLVSYEYMQFDLEFEKRTISSVKLVEEEESLKTPLLVQPPKNTTGFLLDLNTVAEQLEATEGEHLSISIQKNRIDFDLKGTIKTKSKFGSITSIKYWMYTSCHLAFSPPPIGNGTLLTHNCRSWK